MTLMLFIIHDDDECDVHVTQALDYVIYAAGRAGIKLILALGNLWPAYKGPEDFLYDATGESRARVRSRLSFMLTCSSSTRGRHNFIFPRSDCNCNCRCGMCNSELKFLINGDVLQWH